MGAEPGHNMPLEPGHGTCVSYLGGVAVALRVSHFVITWSRLVLIVDKAV